MARKTNITAKLVLLSAMIYGVLSLVSLSAEVRAAQSERDAAALEIEQVESSIDELGAALSARTSPISTEQQARDDLRMMFQDETLFYYKQP